MTIEHVHTKETYTAAAALFNEYANWLGIDLCFQNFDKELETLETMYAAPNGGIILCREEENYVACVAIRRIDSTTAELKRMYVQPAQQGKGIGAMLLKEAIQLAEKLGYKAIRLDTLDSMQPAIGLYKKNGFYAIAPYYHNPNSNALYFEKKL